LENCELDIVGLELNVRQCILMSWTSQTLTALVNPVWQVGQVFERGVLAAVGLSHKRSTKRTRVTYGESRHSDRARLIGRGELLGRG